MVKYGIAFLIGCSSQFLVALAYLQCQDFDILPSNLLQQPIFFFNVMTERFLFVQVSLSLSVIINYITFYYFPIFILES